MTRFAGVGIASWLLDTLLVALVAAVTGNLAVAVVVARLVSGGFNFTLNRVAVFRESTVPLAVAAGRYVTLAVALLGASYLMLSALVGMGITLVVAKVATDVALFGLSYLVQRALVFAVRVKTPTAEPVRETPRGVRELVGANR